MKARVITLTAVVIYLGAAATAVLHSQATPASTTVWNGVFTSEQAARGQAQFADNCASCHAPDLSGGEGPALVGDRFWNRWRETTLETLLSFVSKNMPHSEDGSLEGKLPAPTYAALVAHILNSNGMPAGSTELSAESSVGVQIVGRDGPRDLPGGTLAHIVGCLEKAGSTWRIVKATKPTRAQKGSTAAADRTVALGTGEFTLKFVLTSLDRYVGQRVSATGALIGEGGVDGINVDFVNPVSPMCQ
jgi:S-disulfanyl-L-cysteine oxidoreductase SoxD